VSDTLETGDVTVPIVAFHVAIHAFATAQKEWARRQTVVSAAALESAAESVETALGMMVVTVPAGLAQELRAVDEWRRTRGGMMDLGITPRLRAPVE
jgi:hypothetical protein